jgi:hypothetical protein
MPCPLYSQRGHRCSCAGVRGDVVPTLHERESFCSTASYGACPTLLANIRKGRPLTEAEYLMEWTGEPVGRAPTEPRQGAQGAQGAR